MTMALCPHCVGGRTEQDLTCGACLGLGRVSEDIAMTPQILAQFPDLQEALERCAAEESAKPKKETP